MPRGVYDRSKSKEQREVEKVQAKPNKKVAKQVKAKTGSQSPAPQVAQGRFGNDFESREKLAMLGSTLSALADAKHKLGNTFHNNNLEVALANTFLRIERISERIETLVPETNEKAETKQAEVHQTAPTIGQVPAPVQFNPPTPNGAAA